jgi:3-methyladenine DNA glycosylase AlkD
MNPQELFAEIRNYCLEYADAENVIKYSRYFKDGLYDGYGLTAPQIYAGAKELLHKEFSLTLAMDAAPDIILHGKSEEISMIMLMIKDMHRQYSKATFKAMENWYKLGINNWAHADTMGMMILPVFLNKGIVKKEDFSGWLTAKNKFQRRSVPVTFIKILKTYPRFTELFDFIEILMADPEREVHQGTGWFLREAWKRNQEETEIFLLKWKDVSPRLIFQYATEKMTAEGKIRFRRERVTRNK